jgi:ComF family protein
VIGAIFGHLLELCFPWSCAVCEVGFEGRGPLCAGCRGKLEKLEGEPHCGACAMPLPMRGSPCPYCKGKGPANFDRVVRLAAFAEPARRMIHHLKYHRRWGIGEELADRLWATEGVRAMLSDTDVIVPVPLHWRRQVIRGYNQADVLARRLAARTGRAVKVVRAVRRVRHTPQQTQLLSAARRAENLKDAFALVAAGRLAGKRVVIVDDVWTTGATMQAVARVIKRAKPKGIAAIVVAVANPRGLERVEKAEDVVGVELDY